jgi:hypothetical protein
LNKEEDLWKDKVIKRGKILSFVSKYFLRCGQWKVQLRFLQKYKISQISLKENMKNL